MKLFYSFLWEVFPDVKIDVQELIERDEAVVIRYVIDLLP